jgi:S-(hydroxymethyl)glutathione dehydrogenase/alcohol dehydrogenase
MKTKAAVLWGVNEPWSVEEVELGDPVAGEVRVKLAASGLCHSDEHLVTGDLPVPFPVVGGHEGAGVVEAVGPGVASVKEGDHVVLGFIPSCGKCVACSTGHTNLCDLGAGILGGPSIADGTFRVKARGQDTCTMCLLGTFSPYVVVHEHSVIKIEDDLPLDKAALVGCGVTTGFGSAVYAAEVAPGDTVVVVGCGGIGSNAIQGARIAGAERIIAVDPSESRREAAQVFGATHTAASVEEAAPLVTELTWGRMANKVILTAGVVTGDLIAPSLALTQKLGRVVVTGLAPFAQMDVQLSLLDLTLYEKELRGSLFGSANPRADIPKLLDLYRHGQLMLDELVTTTYALEDINQGYEDMRSHKNTRGMIVYD